MKNKPKKSLRMIIRQFLSRVIVTFEAMFELSCNIATTMTGLNFKSRIQIKVVFLVGHLKWQIVRIRILILIHFYIKQGIAVIFHFFSFNFFQKLINVPYDYSESILPKSLSCNPPRIGNFGCVSLLRKWLFKFLLALLINIVKFWEKKLKVISYHWSKLSFLLNSNLKSKSWMDSIRYFDKTI